MDRTDEQLDIFPNFYYNEQNIIIKLVGMVVLVVLFWIHFYLVLFINVLIIYFNQIIHYAYAIFKHNLKPNQQ